MSRFPVAPWQISPIRAALPEMFPVEQKHVTQIPDFFFFPSPEDLQNLQKEIISTPSTLLTTPMTQAMEDLGRFTSVNTFGHLGKSRSLFAKAGFCGVRCWVMLYQAAVILTYPGNPPRVNPSCATGIGQVG